MRLSGIDPGIIRELSGIYKPFVKAFKELISNAYDADAKSIAVVLHDDFSRLDVIDDGVGMTPYELHQDFTRLGGSSAWQRGGKSVGGRPRIGYKGIGFLAVARYCSALHVDSYSKRPLKGSRQLARGNRYRIPLTAIVGDVIPLDQLDGHIHVTAVRILGGKRAPSLHAKDYQVTHDALHLLSTNARAGSQYEIDYEVDCRHLQLHAKIDFDYLRSLERKADLRVLEDFCTLEITPATKAQRPGTTVGLHGLKDFVVRELGAPAVKGKARNIAFKSGEEQFKWRLARATPVEDKIPATLQCDAISLLKSATRVALPCVTVKWRQAPAEALERTVYLAAGLAIPFEETAVPVDIDEGGLRVVGYILARSEIIFPAELRGISIRVRNVPIGEPSFLGWEDILSGPRKAAMSQITGELRVISGLDSADAINPGRESFHEEHAHYKILKRHLVGSGETIGGVVGGAIRAILDRSRVRGQVTDTIATARTRRKTLSDISGAVNFRARAVDKTAATLTAFFGTTQRANGLAGTRDVQLRPSHKIGGFDLYPTHGLGKEFEIDYGNKSVAIDFDHDVWNMSLYLSGHYYDVVLKQGRPDHAICEFDNEERRIYVNWGHPVKIHMDADAFLKSAILLRLAHHAADDADSMMGLALNLLAFRDE
jgi:hypothetical protein